jgi:pantothenate kinase
VTMTAEETLLSHLPPPGAARRLIAIAGPPASGKSTLAQAFCSILLAKGQRAALVPMDGFHLDNPVLRERGLLARKGAPETFDAAGFSALIPRLQSREEVAVPLFDRPRDIAVAGAAVVARDCDYVIVEGNYLLFDEAPWRGLAARWDLSAFIAPSDNVLRERLVGRWLDHGLTMADAISRAEGNDLANARRIMAARLPSDLDFTT